MIIHLYGKNCRHPSPIGVITSETSMYAVSSLSILNCLKGCSLPVDMMMLLVNTILMENSFGRFKMDGTRMKSLNWTKHR